MFSIYPKFPDFLAWKTRKGGIEDDLQDGMHHNKCSSIDWLCFAHDYGDGLYLELAWVS